VTCIREDWCSDLGQGANYPAPRFFALCFSPYSKIPCDERGIQNGLEKQEVHTKLYLVISFKYLIFKEDLAPFI
jgi:hypothetical protein